MPLFPCRHQKSTSNDFLECIKNVTNKAFSFEHDHYIYIYIYIYNNRGCKQVGYSTESSHITCFQR